ncbi:MAG: bacteriohemerythrin [Treponema sp.]|nr:bacteriohemerythrin [Treponema sp.]
MGNKVVVQWQGSYSIGIKLVDEQHMVLINMTNKLFTACMAGRERSRSTFLEIIREAIDYVGYHFSTEEKLMERVNYPEMSYHKKQHAEFVREVLSKVEDFNAGRTITPLAFVYFLRDWVLHHIAVCDKKVGEYLMELSKTGELAKITVKVKKDESTNRVQFQ